MVRPDELTTGRERTYGWYPPMSDIYGKPPYKTYDPEKDKENYFKAWYNAYTGKAGSKVPCPPGMGGKPQTPSTGRSSSFRRSAKLHTKSRPGGTSKNAEQPFELSIQGIRKAEAPRDPEFDRELESRLSSDSDDVITPPPPPPQIPHPNLRGWGLHSITSTPSATPITDFSDINVRNDLFPPSPDISIEEIAPKNVRIKSAASYRDFQHSRPKRPVKSAAPYRSILTEVQDQDSDRPKAPTPDQAILECPVAPVAPVTPSTERKQRIKSAPPTSSGRSSSAFPQPPARPATAHKKKVYEDDYDRQLKKHGWRMQVQGDPLNLKGPVLTKRMNIVCEIPIPEIPPEPPKCQFELIDTFFLNTIPRRPAVYDIGIGLQSEVLHAKRLELQKRQGGIKYRYKNFSFIY